MIDLAEKTVNLSLKFGAEFAEARVGRVVKTTIRAVDDKVEKITSGTDKGVGIRTLHKGAFGFVSSNSFNRKDLEESSRMAVKAAKASSTEIKEKTALAPVKAHAPSTTHSKSKMAKKVTRSRKL